MKTKIVLVATVIGVVTLVDYFLNVNLRSIVGLLCIQVILLYIALNLKS